MPAAERLPVNEVFETIQGEAHWTGTPAVFVRLQGCDVGCPWCDTKHTWAVNPADEVDAAVMLSKLDDGPEHAQMTAAELVGVLEGFTARHCVITGGEPLVHDLTELTAGLMAIGWRVQVETSGTQPPRVAPGTWVTLSPKIGMPGGFAVRLDAIERADEIKIPVGKLADIEHAVDVINLADPKADIWLQPLSASEKATALCIREATHRGHRVSLQTHRFIGVR